MAFYIPVLRALTVKAELDGRAQIPWTFAGWDLGKMVDNPNYYRTKYAKLIAEAGIEPEAFLLLASKGVKREIVNQFTAIGPFDTRDAAEIARAVYRSRANNPEFGVLKELNFWTSYNGEYLGSIHHVIGGVYEGAE